MAESVDPQWSEQLQRGRIIDPLQVDRVRNRILTDLLFGIVSIQIYQRLRYISFFLWCLDNLEDPSKQDIVPLEKVFLLANVAHDHQGAKDRGENGLSGSSSVPWNRDELQDESQGAFSIADDEFKIMDSGSSAFSAYYKSIMDRLLVTDGLEPTPLGEQIADAFDAAVDVDFAEVEAAADSEEVPQDLVQRFSQSGCCCLLDGAEEGLLRKAYFSLVSPGSSYVDLAFTDVASAQELDIAASIQDTDILSILDVPEEATDVDEYLDRYFVGNFGAKMRESLTVFLWIADQFSRDTETPLSEVEAFADIQELWRLARYYDYFNYACESLLFAVLWSLKSEDAIYPDALLNQIISNPTYAQTVQGLLDELETESDPEERDALDAAFQYLYFDEPPEERRTVQVIRTDNAFEGTWTDLQAAVRDRLDPAAFNVDDELAEWKLKQLIGNEVSDRAGEADDVSARVFAYVTVLLAILKLREEHYFSSADHEQYWQWFVRFENRPPGALSILETLDTEQELSTFVHEFSKRWVIKQHDKALYEKMEASRMPRLFTRDVEGRMEFARFDDPDYGEPGLTETKYERMVDILLDLGLLNSADTGTFDISVEGRDWLEQFVEVGQ